MATIDVWDTWVEGETSTLPVSVPSGGTDRSGDTLTVVMTPYGGGTATNIGSATGPAAGSSVSISIDWSSISPTSFPAYYHLEVYADFEGASEQLIDLDTGDAREYSKIVKLIDQKGS